MADVLSFITARSKVDYDTVLADSEREAVADLLNYLENVCVHYFGEKTCSEAHIHDQRAETDFFSGEPLNALSTLVYSQNIDLQRSASLTFAEITERGKYGMKYMLTSYMTDNGSRCTGS